MNKANNVLDLGVLEGPVLVFGGPYSNLQATDAMMAETKRRGIPAGNVICTGDVVAYAGDPAATTDAIMNWEIATVMGNCEESFGAEADDCGCGFEEGTACDVMSRQWYAYANACLTPAHRAWMRGLPRQINFTLGTRRFAVIHGSASSINEFVFEKSDDAVKRAGLDMLSVDAVIGGHSGVPFAEVLDSGLWLNSGVIGMPANDATPRVWYAVLCPVDGGLNIELCALDYDHAAAARAMREKKLPEGYARCLETGLWPNMDVMPAAEREKAGKPIAPETLFWQGAVTAAAE
ncbi:MAG: metallophosphoesterase family protein [Rhodospirillales bacterium]|nr:metallophosphoesterase family protein [Rhodospirillales bacterium]MBO6787981.1 metallophosphoesterase family protein [Rhodospirillales bacterium]